MQRDALLAAAEERAEKAEAALRDTVKLVEAVAPHVAGAVKASLFWDGQVNRIGRALRTLDDICPKGAASFGQPPRESPAADEMEALAHARALLGSNL